MRPILHPSIEDVPLEAILHALSDPARVAIFAEIAGMGCVQGCTNLASTTDKGIPKSSLSQHFKVLREAGLVHSERQGVEMRNSSRCVEVDARFPGLIPAILKAHARSRAECEAKSAAAE
jgi:DNA-binding transcriptional ArsR family regulator